MQDTIKDTNLTPSAAALDAAPIETPHSQELYQVEELTNELKRLLVRHENTLEEEGIRQEVETLERWMESYRRGLAAAGKISGTGKEWLSNVRDHLKLAADEMHRLESEGGNPAGKEQAEKTEELLKAIRRIDKVIPDMDNLFGKATPEQVDA